MWIVGPARYGLLHTVWQALRNVLTENHSPASPSSKVASGAPDAAQTVTERHGEEFAAIATLEGLTGADSERLRFLEILTNPKNHNGSYDGTTRAELYEALEETDSYLDFAHSSDVQNIADILGTHYSDRHRDDGSVPEFSFGFECNSEGEIGSYGVSAIFGGWSDGVTLSSSHDIKHSTVDREASGRDSAVAIAVALDAEYQRLVAKGRSRGLCTATGVDLDAASADLAAFRELPGDVDADTMAGAAGLLADHLASFLTAQGRRPR